jgi:hypothetical protein
MTACLGVCLSHPQGQLASTSGTPTRWRKSLSPMDSVRKRVAIVLSGLLRGACSLGTWTLYEVCHAGVCFTWEARSHCLLHSATRQARISPFVSIRPLLSIAPLVALLYLCCVGRRGLPCRTAQDAVVVEAAAPSSLLLQAAKG